MLRKQDRITEPEGGVIKQTIRASAVVVVAAVMLVAFKGCSVRPADDPDTAIKSVVADLVKKDKMIKNCVIAVARGDGSFSSSAAAGVARQDRETPMTKETPIYVASITKLYTAVTIMRLYEKGALSLDDPMSRYLPDSVIKGIHEYKEKDYSHLIKIKHLLSHTSGIADYYEEKPQHGKSLFELFLEKPDRLWTVDQTIERARQDLHAHFRPGRRASYSDTNYQLLGKIIEAVTQKPLHAVFEEFFFGPLGLTHTYLVGWPQSQAAPPPAPADVFYKDRNITAIRSNGAYWAEGGVISTAPEMITFLRALNEGKIIRHETLNLMHKWRSLEFPLEYGYGTMRFKLPWLVSSALGMPETWGHSGSTGSFLYYCRDLDLYLAGTIDQTDSKTAPFMLMRKIMKIVRSKTPATVTLNGDHPQPASSRRPESDKSREP